MAKQSNPYAPYFTNWPTKLAGPKPTQAELAMAEATGTRAGTKVALALAMYFRPGGASNLQVVCACGNSQNNKRRELIAKGTVSREMVPNNAAGHTVYKIKPAGTKAKRQRKPRAKAAAKAAEQPSS